MTMTPAALARRPQTHIDDAQSRANRAFQAPRIFRHRLGKVKPFPEVDEAVVRYLSNDEASRGFRACTEDFGKKRVQACSSDG